MAAANLLTVENIETSKPEHNNIVPVSDDFEFYQQLILITQQGLDASVRSKWLIYVNGKIEQSNVTETILTELLNVAEYLCDWQLIIKLHQRYPKSIEMSPTQLALGYWKAGLWDKSYQLLERAMLQSPNDKKLFNFYNDLLDQAEAQVFSRYSNPDVSSRLSLEPLSLHHGNEYLWQFWDEKIAEMCCLAPIHSEHDWRTWLMQQHDYHDQVTFAVVHKDHGFIGVVCLIVHDTVGFFYYWLGKDYQQQGLGTEAARLLLDLGENCYGLACCYAKVFDNNTPSQHSLQKLGFKKLPFKGAQPNENEYFYYLGETKTAKGNALELTKLFSDMQSFTKVDLPLDWQVERCRQLNLQLF